MIIYVNACVMVQYLGTIWHDMAYMAYSLNPK
jgi:hypothetical protein